MDIALAAAGLLAVMTAWGTYLATIPRGTVPLRPWGAVILQLIGVGLAVGGLLENLRGGGSGAPAYVLAGFAIMMGSMFLILLSLAKTPNKELQAKVGEPLPGFSAQTSEGIAFSSASFGGKRVLLKFFRGGW